MNLPTVRRAFVTVGERQVHYRQAGEGPPVLLLHQSPASSAELEPLMRHLAPRWCVIAPDTPGYGHSDPLGPAQAQLGIDAYADALAALLDALGLPRAALFGSHTGAIIATRFAARHPGRVSALVANGILLNSAEERAELCANYFPPFVPDWAGGHLAWLWSRLRDQLVYYPWYQRQAARRIEWAMTLADIDHAARDLLDAGDHYRSAYRAVLDYDIAPDLPRLAMPTCLMVAQTDALVMYVPQYPAASERLSIELLPDFDALPAAVERFLLRQPALAAAVIRPDVPRRYGPGSKMLHVQGAQLHLRQHAAEAGRPLLLLHDLGSSSAALLPLLAGMGGSRPLLAPDLPGHGLSDATSAHTPEAIAELLHALLGQAGMRDADVLAEGASAAVALALAARLPGLQVTLCNPRALAAAELPQLAQHLPPPLDACSAGSHLLRAWTYLKDRDLYSPWGERSAATALPGMQPPPAEALQRGLIDLLRARAIYPRLLAAALRQATWEAIAASGARVLAVPGHAAHTRLAGVQALPVERAGRAGLLGDLRR
ncbi:alpha/beta fold hydrolase [Roseateles sp. LKC17W]|uniref:Alpha/beta fold hydrolase n=1 Tax=Pelomonas margarita TaxID=3299031 RepID=A0ABW7FJN8_9BURK